jgi:hypothetical protein
VRGDKLGGGDPFSAAEKYDGRTVDIIGVEEREHCALVEVPEQRKTNCECAQTFLIDSDAIMLEIVLRCIRYEEIRSDYG